MRAWFVSIEEGTGILLMAIPLFHVYGMVAGMLLAISSGSTMVMVPNPRDIPDVLENINKYHPNTFPGVPTLYNAINNHPHVTAGKVDLSSIRACISGSAPLLRSSSLAAAGSSKVTVFPKRRPPHTVTPWSALTRLVPLVCLFPMLTAKSSAWTTARPRCPSGKSANWSFMARR